MASFHRHASLMVPLIVKDTCDERSFNGTFNADAASLSDMVLGVIVNTLQSYRSNILDPPESNDQEVINKPEVSRCPASMALESGAAVILSSNSPMNTRSDYTHQHFSELQYPAFPDHDFPQPQMHHQPLIPPGFPQESFAVANALPHVPENCHQLANTNSDQFPGLPDIQVDWQSSFMVPQLYDSWVYVNPPSSMEGRPLFGSDGL